MFALLAKPLDWLAIQLARLSVHSGTQPANQWAEAGRLLHDSDFLCDGVGAPADLAFLGDRHFRFSSPIASRWGQNNTVYGRLHVAAQRWQQRPAVVLLHGWNAEAGYRILFPWLAWRLSRMGVNAAMFELPYHSQRKPRGRDAIDNFISDDLLHVAQAAHQSIADARALIAWLKQQGCPRVGLWGISLGAWLGGLLVCADARLDFAVLMTPVARMDRVIAELDFCKPIRDSLRGADLALDPLNLVTYRPKLAPGDILLVASEHDLFAPIETVEELWIAWGRPQLWRPRHGHISVLMSAPVMERTMNWIARKAIGADLNCNEGQTT